MGHKVKAVCECGYETEELFIGETLFNKYYELETSLRVPAICHTCAEIVVGEYPKAVCPKCNDKIIFCSEVSLQSEGEFKVKEYCIFVLRTKKVEDVRLPDVHYLCPKCWKKKLKFVYLHDCY